MRLLASLTAAAALAVTVAPAAAIERTVYVPILRCEISVLTPDVEVAVSRNNVRAGRLGERTEVSTNC